MRKYLNIIPTFIMMIASLSSCSRNKQDCTQKPKTDSFRASYYYEFDKVTLEGILKRDEADDSRLILQLRNGINILPFEGDNNSKLLRDITAIMIIGIPSDYAVSFTGKKIAIRGKLKYTPEATPQKISLQNSEIAFSPGWSHWDYGDSYTNTLFASIEDDNLETVRDYIDNGWPIEKRVGRTGSTALGFAASVGSINTVRYLLYKGADANAVNYSGVTPIMEAIPLPGAPIEYNIKKARVFLELLNDRRVDPTKKNFKGKSILDIALLINQTELVKVIEKRLGENGSRGN